MDTDTYVCVYVGGCTYVRMYVCMWVGAHMYVCTYVCMWVGAHMYVRTQVHTYCPMGLSLGGGGGQIRHDSTYSTYVCTNVCTYVHMYVQYVCT